jgi:hypothetical protein
MGSSHGGTTCHSSVLAVIRFFRGPLPPALQIH